MRIVTGLGRSLRDREIAPDDSDARLGWLLVVGTIPAGLLGLLLEHSLRNLFKSADSAAAFLIVNGFMLYGAERLRRRPPRPGDGEGDSDERIAKLNWRQAIAVGTAQAIALIPGFSRSGATMGGGLLVGLSNEDAARYSFLLATPIIGAAALLKLPELAGKSGHVHRHGPGRGHLCGGHAYLSVRFLLKYFETNTLTPFAIYCVVAGLICTIVFALLSAVPLGRLAASGFGPV